MKKQKGRAEQGQVLNDRSPSLMRESYNITRTNLLFVLADKRYKKIMISSAFPADGKSTVCVNLAATFARAGKRVLVVDCDFRNPVVHKMLHADQAPGLSDILGGNADIACIQSTHLPNLMVLTAGTIPPNPAELLMLASFGRVMQAVSENYDFVFVDTPPVGLFSDAAIISHQTDGAVLVAKYAYTLKTAIARAVESLQNANVEVLGFILNGMGKKQYYERVGFSDFDKYYSGSGPASR